MEERLIASESRNRPNPNAEHITRRHMFTIGKDNEKRGIVVGQEDQFLAGRDVPYAYPIFGANEEPPAVEGHSHLPPRLLIPIARKLPGLTRLPTRECVQVDESIPVP